MKRAFTLIELLVVIAIIAILAAILFPVFAQAKVAAKGAASLSNAKQSSLAVLMYGGDVDDTYVPVGFPDSTAPIGWGGMYIRTWAQSLMPYMKSGDLLLDPLTSPADYSWGPREGVIGYYPQYGYNFTALSPVVDLGQPRPLSQTALGRPAETVMITSKATAGREYPSYWDGGYSLDGSFTIGGPYCGPTGWTDVTPQSWCNYVSAGGAISWGKNSQPNVPFAAGGSTGLVSLRKNGFATVAFADGHAAAMSDGKMAAGTNYNRELAPASLTITNKDLYLWDGE